MGKGSENLQGSIFLIKMKGYSATAGGLLYVISPEKSML